jgi:hypothetical protein
VETTQRDAALLQGLVRFYGLKRQQIHARHVGAEGTAANRQATPARGGQVCTG